MLEVVPHVSGKHCAQGHAHGSCPTDGAFGRSVSPQRPEPPTLCHAGRQLRPALACGSSRDPGRAARSRVCGTWCRVQGLPVPEEQQLLSQHRHGIEGEAGVTEVGVGRVLRGCVRHGGLSQERFPGS